MVRCLSYDVVVVVEPRHHRAWHAAGNAAVEGVEVLPGVELRAVSQMGIGVGVLAHALSLPLVSGHWRESPIWRIDDE